MLLLGVLLYLVWLVSFGDVLVYCFGNWVVFFGIVLMLDWLVGLMLVLILVMVLVV